MPHLSVRELNRIVEIATDQYKKNKSDTNAFDYLSACLGLVVRPETIAEKNEDSEEELASTTNFSIDYNNQKAAWAFRSAKDSAGQASENQDQVFASVLRETYEAPLFFKIQFFRSSMKSINIFNSFVHQQTGFDVAQELKLLLWKS